MKDRITDRIEVLLLEAKQRRDAAARDFQRRMVVRGIGRWLVIVYAAVMTAIIFVLALMTMAQAAQGAPAPSREPPPRVVGNWVMTWGGGEGWAVRFDPSGRYYCQSGDRTYAGRWNLMGDVLVIRERQTWPPPIVWLGDESWPDIFATHAENVYTVHLEPGKVSGQIHSARFDLRKEW